MVSAVQVAKFVTGFSRWVKGQAQGLQPGGFKLRVNCVQLAPPRRVRLQSLAQQQLHQRGGAVARREVKRRSPGPRNHSLYIYHHINTVTVDCTSIFERLKCQAQMAASECKVSE
jgi:hypothetical protein